MQEHYVPTDDAISSYAIPPRDTYEYDALNRVTQANGVQRTTGGSWPSVYAQHYSYDRWGNRWINSGGTWGTNIFNTVITPDSANNRLTGMTYDLAGNTTNDPITGGGARTYDADNRMISAQSGATWSYYVYDADGKRVRRIVAGTETWHVYGFSGELLAEYPVKRAKTACLAGFILGRKTACPWAAREGILRSVADWEKFWIASCLLCDGCLFRAASRREPEPHDSQEFSGESAKCVEPFCSPSFSPGAGIDRGAACSCRCLCQLACADHALAGRISVAGK